MIVIFLPCTSIPFSGQSWWSDSRLSPPETWTCSACGGPAQWGSVIQPLQSDSRPNPGPSWTYLYIYVTDNFSLSDLWLCKMEIIFSRVSSSYTELLISKELLEREAGGHEVGAWSLCIQDLIRLKNTPCFFRGLRSSRNCIWLRVIRFIRNIHLIRPQLSPLTDLGLEVQAAEVDGGHLGEGRSGPSLWVSLRHCDSYQW